MFYTSALEGTSGRNSVCGFGGTSGGTVITVINVNILKTKRLWCPGNGSDDVSRTLVRYLSSRLGQLNDEREKCDGV